MKEKNKTFKYRLEYAVLMGLIMLVKITPPFLAPLKAKCLSYFFYKASKRYRNIVYSNLRIAFPSETEEKILQLKQRVYAHFARILVDILFMFSKKNPGKHVKSFELTGWKNVEAALDQKKGVILFSAHFGNWEIVPYIISRKIGHNINSIAREMDNPYVEKRVKQFREFMGSSVISKRNSLRTILNRLQRNEIVYLLIDQNVIQREAVSVEFFGKNVRAIPSVSQLHIKKGIPAIPIFLHYEKEKIILEVLKPLSLERSGDDTADIQQLTQISTSIIEEKIKQYPEQWFWFHDRWKKGQSDAVQRGFKEEKQL